MCEVTLDERYVLEDRLNFSVVLVSCIDSCHCIFTCEFDVLKLSKVCDVKQTNRVVNPDLGLRITTVKVNTPFPKLLSVKTFSSSFEVSKVSVTLEWSNVNLEFI